MNNIQFTWDQKKNKSNEKKHGIAFEEAQSVFFDEHAIEFFDSDHSNKEDRFILLGLSARLRVLIVCHCYRKENAMIRIISARKATRKEKKYYEKGI